MEQRQLNRKRGEYLLSLGVVWVPLLRAWGMRDAAVMMEAELQRKAGRKPAERVQLD